MKSRKIEQLKNIIDEFEGDKKKMAEHFNVDKSTIHRWFRAVKEVYPGMKYYVPPHRPGRMFPTNKERLKYLDNPERRNKT